jgi:hypothetical protein
MGNFTSLQIMLIIAGLYLAFIAGMIDAKYWYNKLLFKATPIVIGVFAVSLALRG